MATENFQCAKHSLVSSVYYRVHHSWALRKTFKLKAHRKLETAIFSLVFANTVNASLSYTFFQLFYKYYVAFNCSKITSFERCNDPISQASKVKGWYPDTPGHYLPDTVLLFNLYDFHLTSEDVCPHFLKDSYIQGSPTPEHRFVHHLIIFKLRRHHTDASQRRSLTCLR